MLLSCGDKAPDFTLPTDQPGISFTLSKHRGKNILIYFYPKDSTPGCTKEACNFRDHFNEYQKYNVDIIGISKDNAKKHTQFKNKYFLPFTLLVDEDADVCEAYGVINKKSMFGKSFLGITRSTFLIDQQGIIRALWRKVKVADHANEVLLAIKSL